MTGWTRRTTAAMPTFSDPASTPPLRRSVLDSLRPFLTEGCGNPSSAHSFGRTARAALDDAHERVAGRLRAAAPELVVASGGTEANNTAPKRSAWPRKAHGPRLLTPSGPPHARRPTLRHPRTPTLHARRTSSAP